MSQELIPRLTLVAHIFYSPECPGLSGNFLAGVFHPHLRTFKVLVFIIFLVISIIYHVGTVPWVSQIDLNEYPSGQRKHFQNTVLLSP